MADEQQINNDTDKGGAPPAWTAQLPDDLKTNETLTGFKTIGDLGKSYVELHGRSANSIVIPGEDATDEERATFFQKLGRPDKPEGYDLTIPEPPEELAADPVYGEAYKGIFKKREEVFRKVMHDHGIPAKTAKDLYDAMNKQVIDEMGSMRQNRERYHDSQVQALQGVWKEKYKPNAEAAMKIAGAIGGEKFTAWLDRSGMGDNPILAEFCFNVHQEISRLKALTNEDRMLAGDRSGGGAKNAGDAIFPEMAAAGAKQ